MKQFAIHGVGEPARGRAVVGRHDSVELKRPIDELVRLVPDHSARVLRRQKNAPAPATGDELFQQRTEGRIRYPVENDQRFFLRRRHPVNSVGDFTEHAPAEGAVTQPLDNVADGRAGAQIQRLELFEFCGFHGFCEEVRLLGNTQIGFSQFNSGL